MNWLMEALRESHHEEKSYHEAAITTIQPQYNNLQNRIDQAYTDKLDRKIPEGSVEKSRQRRSLPSPERLRVYALNRFDAQARRQVAIFPCSRTKGTLRA